MNLEDQVTSLELSRRLDKLGVRQRSVFNWKTHVHPESGEEFLWKLVFGDDGVDYDKEFSAFTVAELGEILPDGYHTWRFDYPEGNRKDWACNPPGDFDKTKVKYAGTEADAKSLMFIYLIENNLLDPNTL